jgi:hypothetical protein
VYYLPVNLYVSPREVTFQVEGMKEWTRRFSRIDFAADDVEDVADHGT